MSRPSSVDLVVRDVNKELVRDDMREETLGQRRLPLENLVGHFEVLLHRVVVESAGSHVLQHVQRALNM